MKEYIVLISDTQTSKGYKTISEARALAQKIANRENRIIDIDEVEYDRSGRFISQKLVKFASPRWEEQKKMAANSPPNKKKKPSCYKSNIFDDLMRRL